MSTSHVTGRTCKAPGGECAYTGRCNTNRYGCHEVTTTDAPKAETTERIPLHNDWYLEKVAHGPAWDIVSPSGSRGGILLTEIYARAFAAALASKAAAPGVDEEAEAKVEARRMLSELVALPKDLWDVLRVLEPDTCRALSVALARPAAAVPDADAALVAELDIIERQIEITCSLDRNETAAKQKDPLPSVVEISLSHVKDAVARLRRLAARPAPVGAVPEELRKLSEAATDGPWYSSHELNKSRISAKTLLAHVYSGAFRDWPNQAANADFIVAAVNYIRAALSAARQAGETGDGWQLVPVEPTQAMIEAGNELSPIARGTETHRMYGGVVPEDYWRAMLAAAPHPTSADTTGDGR